MTAHARAASLEHATATVQTELALAAQRLASLGVPAWTMKGRMLRPLVGWASASDVAADRQHHERFWAAALAVQLAHEASLIHDDVVDHAARRRGEASVVGRSGVGRALLHGDHLLTSAYSAATMTEHFRFVALFASAVERTVAGERRQGSASHAEMRAGAWRQILLGKSGELFGCAMAVGAILRGESHEAPLELGRRIGVLYQMYDDLLDYCPDADTGKEPLADYRATAWTWPLAHAPQVTFGLTPREVVPALFGGAGSPAARALEQIESETDALSRDIAGALGPGTVLLPLLEEWRTTARAGISAGIERWGTERPSATRVPSAAHSVAAAAPKRADWERYMGAHSRSFRFASSVLPPHERKRIAAVYAWCRYTDDLVDDASSAGEASTVLDAWLERSRRAYEGDVTGIDLLDRVMRETRNGGVPFSTVAELIAGMRMDARHRPYADRRGLGLYTWRAAGTVGLWLAELYGVRDPWALERAATLGQAMQLTNILRDVGEDLDRGRVYLPLDVLRAHGLSVDDLRQARAARTTPGLAWNMVLEELMEDAAAGYHRSAEALDALPVAFRRAVTVASSVYSGIHDAIRRNGYDSLNRRATTSLVAKVSLGARALLRFGPGRSRARVTGGWARLLAAEPA